MTSVLPHIIKSILDKAQPLPSLAASASTNKHSPIHYPLARVPPPDSGRTHFMELVARRRLALLSSHIHPLPPPEPELSARGCASGENHEEEEADCVFCKIIRGQAPALKIYEDAVCLCILDVNPLSQGHSLIIPKQHFSSLEATPPAIVAAMCSKVPLISKAVKKATGCDSFNLLVNNGVAAGQVIFHTHIHIIPRKASDCLWASESLRRRKLKLDQEAAQLAHTIRETLQSLDDFEDTKIQVSSVIGT